MLFVVTVTAVAFVAVSGFGVEAAGSQRFGLAEFAAWPAPTPVDASFAARITAEHNVIRAKYDLPPLQWDRALADRAQEWADKLALFAKLPPDHRDDTSIGENIIWGGSGALTPQSVVARWAGEAANYNIATNTCADGKSCLHFTQVVWSTTTKVGCGKARTADGMTDFVVCDYSPPGNIGQQPPFKPTPPTTAQVKPSPTSTPNQSIHWNQNVPGKIYDTESQFPTPVPSPQSTPAPKIGGECDACKSIKLLTEQVEQLKKQLDAYAKLTTPKAPPEPTIARTEPPNPVPTPSMAVLNQPKRDIRDSAFKCKINTDTMAPFVAAEGIAEQVGDIVIKCSGGVAPEIGMTLPTVDIRVFLNLNTNITSRVFNDNTSEALLFIDDPQPAAQSPCAPASGSTVCNLLTAGPGGTAVDAGGVVRNIFQGRQVAANGILFTGVPINVPTATTERVLRIKNIRANGNQLGVSSTLVPTQVTAYVSTTPASRLEIENPTVTVAYVQESINFRLYSRYNADHIYQQSISLNPDLASGKTIQENLKFSVISFQENFQGSWKTRDANLPLKDPGTQQNLPQNVNGAPPGQSVASGFYNTGFTSINGLNRAGRADHGTRLMAQFSGVPNGVQVWVSAGPMGKEAKTIEVFSGGGRRVTSADPMSKDDKAIEAGPMDQDGKAIKACNFCESSPRLAAWGVKTDPNGSGPASPVEITNGSLGGPVASGLPGKTTQGLVQVLITNGAGTFVWEVFGEDPYGQDNAAFAVVYAYVADPGNNLPAPGIQSGVWGSLAPFSKVGTASDSAPLARFVVPFNRFRNSLLVTKIE